MTRVEVDREADIAVATASGPGVGRFLADALVDALESDQALVALRESAVIPSECRRAVDFVFARTGSEREEVIRVGLDGDGAVVSTQLLRCVRGERWSLAGAARHLLDAIRAADSISGLQWEAGSGASARRILSITMRLDRQLEIVPE